MGEAVNKMSGGGKYYEEKVQLRVVMEHVI